MKYLAIFLLLKVYVNYLRLLKLLLLQRIFDLVLVYFLMFFFGYRCRFPSTFNNSGCSWNMNHFLQVSIGLRWLFLRWPLFQLFYLCFAIDHFLFDKFSKLVLFGLFHQHNICGFYLYGIIPRWNIDIGIPFENWCWIFVNNWSSYSNCCYITLYHGILVFVSRGLFGSRFYLVIWFHILLLFRLLFKTFRIHNFVF